MHLNDNNGYAHASQRYVIRTLPAFVTPCMQIYRFNINA